MAVILGVYPSGIVYLYMVIRLVSQFCTIYLLGAGVFATEVEVSCLIGTCIYVHYLSLGHNIKDTVCCHMWQPCSQCQRQCMLPHVAALFTVSKTMYAATCGSLVHSVKDNACCHMWQPCLQCQRQCMLPHVAALFTVSKTLYAATCGSLVHSVKDNACCHMGQPCLQC